jgi:regulator of replication initiation timing
MVEKKVGRKRKYDSNMLIGLINKYSDENPYAEIKIADLVRRFEIKNHIWRDYQEVRDYIDKLNGTSKILSMPNDNVAMVSVDDFLEANKSDKKMKQAIGDLLETNNKLFKLALKAEKFIDIEQDYLGQIKERNHDIKKLKKVIEHLNSEIDSLYLDSRSTKERQDKGIKDNLVKLNVNSKKLSKSSKDIKAIFPGLFND